VADADAFNWGFTFKRWMPPDVIEQMHGLLILLRHITLNEEQDKPFWKWTKSGKFTVKSIYITCATILLADTSDICGKVRFLSRLKFGCGLFGTMQLQQKITC
jgi:hypothetical protein